MEFSKEPHRLIVAFGRADAVAGAVILVGVAAGLAVFFGIRSSSASGTNPPPPAADVWAATPVFTIETDGHPSTGPADAPVTIVEFTDYECPFCGQHARQVLPALLAPWGDTLRYVVRNFPNLVLHPRALQAAEAVECAHRQGRFWDYRALLHELPLDLSTGRLASAAVQSAIDTTRFRACVEERATREVVALDLLAAWEAGVFGTPTFFVNGRRFGGERTLDQLNELVRLALASGSQGR